MKTPGPVFFKATDLADMEIHNDVIAAKELPAERHHLPCLLCDPGLLPKTIKLHVTSIPGDDYFLFFSSRMIWCLLTQKSEQKSLRVLSIKLKLQPFKFEACQSI